MNNAGEDHSSEEIQNSTVEEQSSSGGKSSMPRDISLKWTKAINALRKPIYDVLHFVTDLSARNPGYTISLVIFLSIALLIVGLVTNFRMDSDEDMLWTPRDSPAVKHRKWIDDHSGFPEEPRAFFLFFHHNGANIISEGNVFRVFEALDVVRELPHYDEMCLKSDFLDEDGIPICRIFGVTQFWNDDATKLAKESDIIGKMSNLTFSDGSQVNEKSIFGYAVRNDEGRLQSAQSFMQIVYFSGTDLAEDLEGDAVGKIVELDKKWQKNSSINLRVEVAAHSSFQEEMARAIVADVPLVPLVFIIMSIFCVLVFFKRDRLYSRSMLGFCGVVGVLFSLFTGYGLMFICGVPLTPMTQLLPFIVFGIGLDDVFILTCSYDRTDRSKSAVGRIHGTIDDVGLSVTMTSLTSTMAFGLGCMSTIPAIFWLCLYGFPTVVLVYVYQMTFFVACMVLDERRMEANRHDCCCCLGPRDQRESLSTTNQQSNEPAPNGQVVDHFMAKAALVLRKPSVKILVTILFLVLAAGLGYSSSKLKQGFDYKDMLPDDSYLKAAFKALDEYQARSGASPFVYFRYVNQSDQSIRDEMAQYVMDLVEIDAIEDPPKEFWVWDFQNYTLKASQEFQNLSFEKQLQIFLAEPAFHDIYVDNIVFNENGEVTASRCQMYMDNVDWDIVTEQIDALNDQREVTKQQRINKGSTDGPFFTYFRGFYIWELYRASVIEIIKTTIIGVFAVTAVSLVLIPHWSAPLFVFPFICLLYIDLLGWIQIMGLEVNAVTYIGMAMSIGLLVDFVMHILLRYYESNSNRVEKTVDTLRTMGSSIFLGGITSLLGTVVLAFSSSSIFFSVFVVFFGLVVLGVLHGLIFLPVVLSTFGPEDPPTNMATQIEKQSSAGPSNEEP